MKKIIRAAKCAAAAVLCAVGVMSLSGCENYKKMLRDSPDEYIDMAMENTMESIGGNTFTEEKKLFEQALKDGSFSLGFDVEGLTFNGVCEVNEKLGAVSQMYTLSNAEGKSAQIYIYADDNGFKFGTIGDSVSHIYDVTIESFAEKLAASIFAPGSGSAYEMSETDYNALLKYAETFSSAVKNAESKGDDKYQKVIDDFKNSLDPAIEEKTDIDIGGETVKANTITYTVSTDKIKDLLNQLFDLMAEDGQLDPNTTGYSEEEMRAQFDEAMSSLEEIYVVAEYDINAKTNMLMQSDIFLNVTADGETAAVRFKSFFGADPASAEKQTHTLGINADGENTEIVMDVTYAEISATETSTVVTANMTSGGENKSLFTINTEKNGDNYSLSVNIGDEITAGMEGTISTSGNSFDMTIDKVSAGYGSGEFSYSPNIKVNVKKGGEISALDAESEFLDITEEQLDVLMENIANDFSDVINGTSLGDLI